MNYGFGYGGNGYYGGAWHGDHFRYDTAFTNVNRTVIDNAYVNRAAINKYDANRSFNRASYNGGPGGIAARPTARQFAYRNQPRLGQTAIQRQHVAMASQDRNDLARVNHGVPQHAAFAEPLSRENRPANFAPTRVVDRAPATSRNAANGARTGARSDAFSRFDRGTDARSQSAYRAPERSYRAPSNAYHAPSNAYHAPARAYRPATVYRSANSYRASAAAYHPAYRPAPHAALERHGR